MSSPTHEEKTDAKIRDKPDVPGPDEEKDKTERDSRHPGSRRRHSGSGRHGGKRKTGAERWAEGEDSPLLDASQDCMG